jgi:hypothetical protein
VLQEGLLTTTKTIRKKSYMLQKGLLRGKKCGLEVLGHG